MTDREQRKDRFRDRLSEYLDGSLGVEEEVLIERHLERCEDSARTLAELEAVVDRAASLGPREPAEDLWPGIAARIGARPAGLAGVAPDTSEAPTRRRLPAGLIARFAPQLAAGIALAWLSGALVWTAVARDDVQANAGAGDTSPGLGAPVAPAPGRAKRLDAGGRRFERRGVRPSDRRA